jgi:hypothetical protein
MGISPFPQVITRPCVPLVLALMIGLVLGIQAFETYPPALFWVLVFLLFVFPFVILLFPALSLWTGCGFFFITGLTLMTFLSPQVNTPQVPSFLVNQSPQHLSGVIHQEPAFYPDKTRLVIRLTSYRDQGLERPVEGIILLGVNKLLRGFDWGDPVRFVCRLRLIEGYHNPGGYDYQKKNDPKGYSGFRIY